MAKIPNSDDPADEITASSPPFSQRIELRIGWAERCVTRVAKLKITEARKVGQELIKQADELAESNRRNKEVADWKRSDDNPFKQDQDTVSKGDPFHRDDAVPATKRWHRRHWNPKYT